MNPHDKKACRSHQPIGGLELSRRNLISAFIIKRKEHKFNIRTLNL